MHKIYSIMGVCPQHDILWDLLSPREHITFYGQLKNLHGTELEEATENKKRGGMRPTKKLSEEDYDEADYVE